MDASYRDGGCPNNDTLYSLAWLDLSEEPVILSHPDMGEPVLHLRADGRSPPTTSTTSASARPGQKRETSPSSGPAGTDSCPLASSSRAHAPSPRVLVLGRTLTDGDADVADVHELQAAVPAHATQQWGTDQAAPERRDVYAPPRRQQIRSGRGRP